MSTVILSNLPMGCIESDIHRALLMYGTAVNIEMNPNAYQAVVTMRTKQEAQALLNRRSVNVIGSSVRVDTHLPPTQPPAPSMMAAGQPHVPPTHPMQQVNGYGYGMTATGPQAAVYGGAVPHPQPYPQHQLHQPQPLSAPPPPQPPQLQQPPPMQSPYGAPYTGAQPPYTGVPPPKMPQPPYAPSPPAATQPLPPPQPAPGQSLRTGAHGSGPSHGSGHAIMPAPPQATPRLRVLVEDCRYPITRDVLTQMFSMIAPPVSVSCGPYGPTTAGAVEFADAADAQRAMDQFHNNAMYPNCCYVKLYFEPMWERYDPMQPPYPAPHSIYPYGGGYGYPAPGQPGVSDPWGAPEAPRPRSPAHEGAAPQPPASTTATAAAAAPYERGSGDRTAGAARDGEGAAVRPVNDRVAALGGGAAAPAAPAVRGGRGAVRGGVVGRGAGVAAQGFSPYEAVSGAAPARGGLGTPSRFPGTEAEGCTVMVSCVNESVPLYDLWVLLEVFGNVNSLKRQYRDRTNVVAQFQHPADALTVVQFLQHCPFRGAVLRLKRFNGYQERDTEWDTKPATDPTAQAVLFTTGYHHRTAPRAPLNVRGRIHPDKNLYITNLTEAISDDELKGIMTEAGFEPAGYFRRGPKGAIVGYANTETAVDALIAIHAKEVRERFLRVTFSRFPPGPRPVRDGGNGGGGGEEGERGEEDDDDDADAAPLPAEGADAPADAKELETPTAPESEAVEDGEDAGGEEATMREAAPRPAPKASKPRAKPAKR